MTSPRERFLAFRQQRVLWPALAPLAARLRRHGYDWRERLRALSVPSLVIPGELDLLSPDESRLREAAERSFLLVGSFLGTTTPLALPPSLVPSPR